MKFLIAFLLTGCGAMTGLKVDPKLQGAVDRYMAHVPDQGHYDELTRVQFGDTADEAYGECVVVRNKQKGFIVERHVTIKRNAGTGIWLEVTVAHELAHCLHNKGHDTDGLKLMNPVRTGDETFWVQNLNEQIEGLFK